MRRINEWSLFFKWSNNQIIRKMSKFRNMVQYWVFDKNKMPKLHREVYKYEPDQNLFKYKWHFAAAGTFCGVTGYFIAIKYFTEDYQIRDPGSVIHDEIPMTWSLYRILCFNLNRITWGDPLRMRIDEQVPRIIARLDQYEHYMKLRDNSFDFMYIGELEHIQFM